MAPLLMRVLIVSGALFASASAATYCAADEMDLCVDMAPSKCSDDEMDLCVAESVWDQYPTSSGCSADEMDLCIDIPPAGSGSCSDDEMDLCTPTTPTATSAPTTMAPVTMAPGATNAPGATMAPGATTTVDVCAADEMDLCTGITIIPDADAVYYSGTFTLNFPGDSPTKTQIETAAKKTLSKKLKVDENLITATATVSRRLSVPTASMRRLASTWGVAFTVKGAAADKSAIDAEVAAMKADQTAFQTEMSTQLVAAGVSSTIANSATVQTFTAHETNADGSMKTTTVAPPVETETSNARSISCKLAVAMAFVVAHFASPQVKLFGFASPLSTSSEQ